MDAIPTLTSKKAVSLFGDLKIFTKAELLSRVEVKYEAYSKAINIEALTMLQMAGEKIIPAMMKETAKLADTILAVKNCGGDASVQEELLSEVTKYLKESAAAKAGLEKAVRKAQAALEGREQAVRFRDDVIPAMAELRKPVDEAERIIDKEIWPMPTYSDLLFEV